MLTKIYKGLQEFQKVGLIPEHKTRMSGAQAEGCSPVVTAFKENSDIIKPVKPNTIAKSLAIGNPADGYYALKIIQKTGGHAESVTDEEVVEGIFTLAQTEGVYTETAGGVTIATLKKLAASGRIRPDEVTVAFITGNGYKTQEVISERVKKPIVIEPSIAQFREIYDKLRRDPMPAKVRIPAPLRKLTKEQAVVDIQGKNVEEILANLEKSYPGMKERICDENGQIRRFINVFVNGEDIRFKEGAKTAVAENAEISIIPAIAGGFGLRTVQTWPSDKSN